MHVVGSNDGHKIHALISRQRRLLDDHLLKRAVATTGRQEEIAAAGLGLAGAG